MTLKLITSLNIKSAFLNKPLYQATNSENKLSIQSKVDTKEGTVDIDFHCFNLTNASIKHGFLYYEQTIKHGYLTPFNQTVNNHTLIAYGHYNDSLHQIGWSKLFIETYPLAPPEILGFAAGFLEGVFTSTRILNFYNNLYNIHINDRAYINEVLEFYTKVADNIRTKTSKDYINKLNNPDDIKYWLTAGMILAQTDGLMKGYNTVSKTKGNGNHFYFINADGEVPELIKVFKYRRNLSYYSFKQQYEKFSRNYFMNQYGTDDPNIVWNKIMQNSHCSALIKLVKDKNNQDIINDIFLGHTTWDSYAEMNRISKTYNFTYTFNDNDNRTTLMTFSSYAGTGTSTDDFYLLSNRKMFIMETSLETLDSSLYNKISDIKSYVPNYIRISIANYLSHSPREWCDVFKQNNSGTYSSQWMVVSLESRNKYQLFVLEQMPGRIVYDDGTRYGYENGYWMSFNRPYFTEISSLSGYKEMYQRYGKIYSYTMNPRARIVKSLISQIVDLESFKSVMRYNGDESKNEYFNTISPRYDIAKNVVLRRTFGGIDSKITNFELLSKGKFIAISGPSNENGVEVFDWRKYPEEPHEGGPDVWDFGWNLLGGKEM